MIKNVLIGLAIILTVSGLYVVLPVLGSITNFLTQNPYIAATLLLAVGMQLLGHLFRAERTKLVLDQASSSSLQFQFGALSTGYLFNALLPLRLGEIIRALLVARHLQISFLYTFIAVIIERATDVIFLGILIGIGMFLIDIRFTPIIAITAIGVIFAAAILYGLVLLKNENKYILKAVASLSSFFNASIQNSLRFKIWSLIFGLQSFVNKKHLVSQYASFALFSWFCYFFSAALIVLAFFGFSDIGQTAIASVAPYAISINPVDAGTTGQLATFLPTIEIHDKMMYGQVMWAVLTLPMATMGVGALFLYQTKRRKIKRDPAADPYNNKLLRHTDISQDFPVFLESFFLGNNLAKILHKLEAQGGLRLVKYFKGGSDAITVLVLSDDELYVKKIIPLEYEDRLKAQYDWLKTHEKMSNLVEVIGEQKTSSYYAIDLKYDPETIPFFEYLHHSSIKESQEIIEKIWKSLYSHLHNKSTKSTYDPRARTAFIDKHIYGCVEKAAIANADIRSVLEQPTIVVNGVEYDNLHQIMAKIKANKQAWKDIATYKHSPAVHGDASVDNFLVSPSKKKLIIIDPAPDGNIINGPVFELGKFSQSFYCGYEFLFRDEDRVKLQGKNGIKFREHSSARYMKLWQFIHNELAPRYVDEGERRTMLFHAGALHVRRLKHQVFHNPGNALKFYAVGVKALNDFLTQYETEEGVLNKNVS